MAPQQALHDAACNGDIEKVKTLTQGNFFRVCTNVNKKDRHGFTPLLSAAAMGHDKVVELLLEIPTILVNLADKEGDTPLSMAVKNGHVGVVKLLLKRDEIKVNQGGNSIEKNLA